jgi:hypothetical protein
MSQVAAGFHEIFERIQNYLLGDNPKDSPYNEKILLGHKNEQSISSPPRIVLVAKGGKADVSPEYPGLNSNPSTFRTRDITFEAHCWGKDYKQAEYLMFAVLNACIQAVSGPRAYLDSEDWVETNLNTAGVTVVGFFRITGMLIPRIEMPICDPINDATDRTVIITLPEVIGDPTAMNNLPVTFPVIPS